MENDQIATDDENVVLPRRGKAQGIIPDQIFGRNFEEWRAGFMKRSARGESCQ